VAPMPIFGRGFSAHVTGSSHDEYGMRKASAPEAIDKIVRTINAKIALHTRQISSIEGTMLDDADIVLVAYGSCARTAQYVVKQARQKGLRVGLLRLMGIWPFPREGVREALESTHRVFVLENNLGQLFPEIERLAPEGAETVFLPPEIIGTLHRPAYVFDQIAKEAG
ncbi:pyruvate ferredoxin oxidoreductase, partial [bacterium]